MKKLPFWVKLFSAGILVVLSYLCFYGATFVDPYLMMGAIFFPIIIGFLMTIIYLIVSIINKKIHPLIFSIVFLIISFFMGKLYINYRVNKLNEIGTKIEKFYKENEVKHLDKEEIKTILKINENITVVYFNNGFNVEYKNENRFHYSSIENKVRFRNLP